MIMMAMIRWWLIIDKNIIMLLIVMIVMIMTMMMRNRSMASCAGHLKSINLESNQDGNIDCPLLSPRPYNPYILIYHVKRLSCWWGWLWWLWWWWWCQQWFWSEDDSVLFAKLSQMVSISVLSFCQDFCRFLSKISALPDFIFAFCNLCIARFRFPHSPPSPPLEGCQI